MTTKSVNALRAAAQENEGLRSTIDNIDRDLRDAERARDAVQELLNACLSSDVDAKHSPQAAAVRCVLYAMLKRQGWLPPMEALALGRALAAARALSDILELKKQTAVRG